jgi:hypothetical protein
LNDAASAPDPSPALATARSGHAWRSEGRGAQRIVHGLFGGECPCQRANPAQVQIGDAEDMLELLWLLLTTVLACLRPRQHLVFENLPLRINWLF